MSSFRQLSGQEAKTEFFLAVMSELTSDSEAAVDKLFAEAEEGQVLPPETLTSFKEQAKKAVPIEPFVSDRTRLSIIKALRDDLAQACGLE